MAVDYFHRLVVTGRADRIRDFAKRIYREYPRTVAGGTWTEIVPFSFQALYDIAPRARTIETEVPFDPYELSDWPVRRIGRQDALVRYQFQTRSLEMAPFIRVLARAVPDLTVTLVTFCLDDSSIESYRFQGERQHKRIVSQRVRDQHWERARRKFGLQGDDVYDNDDAERWAEEEMLYDALNHWELGARSRSRRRRYNWWNSPPLRTLELERVIEAIQLAPEDTGEPRKNTRKRKPRATAISKRRAPASRKKR
jgi:hypothetical protein